MSPGDEIRIPIEYRNRSFAIKAHVRQVVDMVSRTDVAADGDGGQLVVRQWFVLQTKLMEHQWTNGR